MMTTAQVQQALNAAGFGPVSVDNVKGPRTVDAIKRFQRAKGLMPDGIVGAKTEAALNASALVAKPTPELPRGSNDIILTSQVIRKVFPFARKDLVQAIVDGAPKIAAAGIRNKLIASHFLSQVGVETGGLKSIEENLNYSAKRLTEVWPNRFPTIAAATPYAKNPQKLANKTYGGRLGNIHPNDGWDFRGGGMLQTTGRDNYRAAGYENNPEALRHPDTALEAALKYWTDHNLNRFAARDDVTGLRKAINGGTHGLSDVKTYLTKAKRALGI